MQSFDYLFDLNIVYFHLRILLLLELPYFYCILIAHKILQNLNLGKGVLVIM